MCSWEKTENTYSIFNILLFHFVTLNVFDIDCITGPTMFIVF